MPDDTKIEKIGYFNTKDEKNSILENAKFQDNRVMQKAKSMENFAEDLKNEIGNNFKNNDNIADFAAIKKSKN